METTYPTHPELGFEDAANSSGGFETTPHSSDRSLSANNDAAIMTR
jgi:hypothetical protein